MTLNGAQQQTPGESGQLQDPKGGEGNKPQDPNAGSTEPQDPGKGEGNAPQDPKPGEGDPQEPKVDHKLEADNRRLQKTVEELQAKLKAKDDAGKTAEERLAAIEKQLAESEEARKTEAANAALASAGCIDLDLGRAALPGYQDVAALKEAKPYLFADEKPPQRSTGGKPVGSAGSGPAKSIHEGLEDIRK